MLHRADASSGMVRCLKLPGLERYEQMVHMANSPSKAKLKTRCNAKARVLTGVHGNCTAAAQPLPPTPKANTGYHFPFWASRDFFLSYRKEHGCRFLAFKLSDEDLSKCTTAGGGTPGLGSKMGILRGMNCNKLGFYTGQKMRA